MTSRQSGRAAAPAKAISLAEWRKQTAGWRKVNEGEVKIDSGEQLLFHWLTPSGADIISLQGEIDRQGESFDREGLDRVGEFLSGVLCDSAGNIEFKDKRELHDAGFGSLETLNIYLEMFALIVSQAADAKKKPSARK